MRKRTLAAALLALSATACENDIVGQIVIAVQTDVHLPKDVDTIRIDVRNEGVPKFLNDYERLGTPEGAFLLPGTLTLVASEEPSDAIQILVTAFARGREGTPRILREVVTTVPPERTVTLQMPLQFLCDGQARIGDDGNVESTCPEGQTCIAGECKDNVVDSATLPDYAPEDIFVPGVCLDVGVCFDFAQGVEVDVDSGCTIDGVEDKNIALQTEGDGICGNVGCFVALDGNSPLGWETRDDGRIQLPPAVCTQLESGKIVSVVVADTSLSCPFKEVSVPTCGPWSAAGDSQQVDGPTVLSGGQQRPSSLSLGPQGTIVWSNGGTLADDGTIKQVGNQGGTPLTLAADQVPPRDVAIDASGVVYWTTSDEFSVGSGSVFAITPGDMNPAELVTGLGLPEGLAVANDTVFWTDFQPAGTGGIFREDTTGGMGTLITQTVNYPYRIEVDATHVYWTDEGVLGVPNGAVQRVPIGGGQVEVIAGSLPTPRGLVLDLDGDAATQVFWTIFDQNGVIMRAQIVDGVPAQAQTLTTGQAFPNHLTIDADYIYWTNRGDGTVRRLAKDAAPGASSVVLAEGQRSPGEIAVDDEFIYWINEGTVANNQLDGSVVRLDKPL